MRVEAASRERGHQLEGREEERGGGKGVRGVRAARA